MLDCIIARDFPQLMDHCRLPLPYFQYNTRLHAHGSVMLRRTPLHIHGSADTSSGYKKFRQPWPTCTSKILVRNFTGWLFSVAVKCPTLFAHRRTASQSLELHAQPFKTNIHVKQRVSCRLGRDKHILYHHRPSRFLHHDSSCRMET